MSPRPPLARWLSAPARLLGGVTCLVSAATAPAASWSAVLTAALIAAVLLVLGRPRAIACALVMGSALAMGASLTWPLIVAGDAHRAAALIARSLSATAMAIAVGSTFTDVELGATLRWFRLPRALVDAVETLFTGLGLLGPLGERMALARRLRGARGFSAGGELLAGLFVLSVERAERLALGRQLRGYDDRSMRSSVRMAWSDVPGLAGAAVAGILVHAVARFAALRT